MGGHDRSITTGAKVSAAFDDPTLVAYGGLEPLMRLAERCCLPALVGERLRLPASKDGVGAFPASKGMALIAGMAGARTASTTWTGCGTARWPDCSPAS
ncbi:hypothetical protein ACFQ0G_11425 [Streptomyces chiangmaiensis]